MDIETQILNLVEDDDFVALDARYHRTNVFQVVGMGSQEIRHSNFIAWLLDPSESHGLGDAFMKVLLTRLYAIADENSDEESDGDVSLFEGISLAVLGDLSSLNVARETESNIDILAWSPSSELVVCIENKVWSGLGNGQLDKYQTYVEKRFASYRHRVYVLLTPDGYDVPADMATNPSSWLSLSYNDIRACLKALLARVSDEKTSMLINDYIDLLEREGIVDTPEVDVIVNRLYKKYQDVFDLVANRKSNAQDAIASLLRDAYNSLLIQMEGEGLLLREQENESKSYIPFHTARMDDYLFSTVEAGSGSWKTGATYRYWIYPRPHGLLQPSIRLELGPLGQRQDVIDRMNVVREFYAPSKKIVAPEQRYRQMKTIKVDVDETETAVIDDVDIEQVTKNIRAGVKKMLKLEDQFFDWLAKQ